MSTRSAAASPVDAQTTLAEHPRFGAASSLLDARDDLYMLVADLAAEAPFEVSEFGPELRKSSAATQRLVLGSPVIRSVLNAVLSERKYGAVHDRTEIARLLTIATERMRAGELDRPLESPLAQRLPGHSIWLWREDGMDEFGRELGRLFQTDVVYGSESENLALRTATRRMTRVIRDAVLVLDRLVPYLARGLLPHVTLIAVVDQLHRNGDRIPPGSPSFESGSSDSVPGIIFLSPSALRSVWSTAEAIFHESCHQKLFDLASVSTIYRSGYSPASSERIKSIWNRSTAQNSNFWSIDRALIAFHVYVHLAALSKVGLWQASSAESAGSRPPEVDFDRGFRRTADRAHYLGHMLRESGQIELGPDGKALVEWLVQVLQELIDPPVPLRTLTARLSI